MTKKTTIHLPSTLASGIEGALLLLEQAYPEETRDQHLRRIMFSGVATVVQTYDRREPIDEGEKPAPGLFDFVENESNPVYAAFREQFCADDNGTHWHTWRDAVAWERSRAGCQPDAQLIEKYERALRLWFDQQKHQSGRKGNAPGHGHERPGYWDSDNGELALVECAECALWAMAEKMSINA